MPRRPRNDAPDTYHHVMNRGIAKRPIFENDRDRRFFLALIAAEVRLGRLEVLAFSLMLTHFHLLVRSVHGELSQVMQRVTMLYSRWFNRSRKRDGPLFRGRFLSRHVDSLRYRRNVVTYNHDNAVDAGVVANPLDDPWSSAHMYASGKRPKWLSTEWVDEQIARRGGDYLTAFPSRVDPEVRAWVEKQLSQRPIREVEDVSLKHAYSPRVVRWAVRKAELADGTRPFRPVLPPNAVERHVARARKRGPRLLGYFKRIGKDAWHLLRAGLLRMLAGCKHKEIAMRVGRHAATVSRDLQDHRRLYEVGGEYARLADTIASAAIRAA